MIKNLKLKFSIMLVNIIPLLLIILVAIAVHMNVQVVGHLSEDAEMAHEVTADIKDLCISVAKMQRSARGYLLSKNETSPKNYDKALDNYKELHLRLTKNIRDPKQLENFRDVSEVCSRVIELTKKVFVFVDESKPEQALDLYKSNIAFKLDQEMDGILQGFNAREIEISTDRSNKQNEAINFLGRVLFGGVFFAIVIALFLGQWLASGITESVATAINNASSTSSEISATIAQHERTATHQATMVTETTTTMEELGASSRQSAEQAACGTGLTKKATTMMDEGKESVKQAIDAMTNLKTKIEAIAQQTLSLGEQTGQVGSIAELVKDFAGQINMLSLNAAVEAARAGEHGKGFAVVASEVRKLSVESKKAAEQAKAILSGIQKATDTTLMRTEEGIKSIESVTATAGSVKTMFDNLSDISGQIFNSSQQVLLNAKQQSLAIGQVIEAVNSINAGAKETAAGLTQTKVGIQNLNDMTNRLKELI